MEEKFVAITRENYDRLAAEYTAHIFGELQHSPWIASYSFGFRVSEIVERRPYPEITFQSRRAYVFVCKS